MSENLNLRIISYNCQSFSTKIHQINSLLNICDILILQETLLMEHNFQIAENLNKDFMCSNSAAVRNITNFSGRSSGGLTIFWRKFNNVNITPFFVTSRIMGIRLKFNHITYALLNIYCNCDYRTIDSLIEYKSVMSDLSNFCSDEFYDETLLAGDFNCDPHKGRFFAEYNEFANGHSLFLDDINFLPPETYTYISPNSSASTSWLDHVLTSNSDIISDIYVMYGFSFDDHIPIVFQINIPNAITEIDSFISETINDFNPIIWDKVSEIDIENFRDDLDNLSINFWEECLSCNVSNCQSEVHRLQLENIYECLTEALLLCSENFPTNRPNPGYKSVVGWNLYCKDLYKTAREHFLKWHNGGRIRSGNIFDLMKSSRSIFKNALNYVRKNELRIRKEILLSKFGNANKNTFWKEIRKLNVNANNVSSIIDDVSNPPGIISVFDNKYKGIFNNIRCQSAANNNFSSNIAPNNMHFLTQNDIDHAIECLNVGMGWDKIHSNLLKFSGPVFRNFILKYFNKLLSHCFVPSKMLKGEIRPRIKNNKSSKSASDNYRPVMNSSNIFKVLEYSILPTLKSFLQLDPCQFAYRRNTSCISAVTILKETVLNYKNEDSNVHCVLLDLSQAFDRLNFKIINDKLKSTGLPNVLVNIIDFMCRNSYVCTRFGTFTGADWKVGNGTRQGGILSPLLFNYYINDVIRAVKVLPVGCRIGYEKTSILCYADDILLTAPSAIGLQQLVDKVSSMMHDLCLKINVNKSMYIVFRKNNHVYSNSSIALHGVPLTRVTKCTYLGITLSEDFSNDADINRATNSFLRQFNGLYHKFRFLNLDVLSFLFKSYCTSFYGMETWYHNLKSRSLYGIGVTYHKAVKKVCGLAVYDSNHLACATVGVTIFKHLHAHRLISYVYSLNSSCSPCISIHKYYFRYRSNLFASTKLLFEQCYDIINLLNNPLSAIRARINYVENHEPRLTDMRPP